MRDDTGAIIGASKIARDITAAEGGGSGTASAAAKRTAAVTERSTTSAPSSPRISIATKVVQAVTDAATELTTAEFGAFFYNVDQRRRRVVHALHDLRRAAGGVLEVPDAAQYRKCSRRPSRAPAWCAARDITKDPRYGHNAPYHGMPHGPPAGAQLSGRAGQGTRRASVIGGLFFGHSGGRSLHRASRAARGRRRVVGVRRARERAAVSAACRRPAGSRTTSWPACRTSCARR